MLYSDDNVIAVVKKAIEYHKLKISSQSIVERIATHPAYPSLKSVCDSFDEWKIQYYAARLSVEELRESSASFIAHMKESGEKLAFVPMLPKSGSIQVFDSNGSSRSLNQTEFGNKYSGVALLLDPHDQSGENDYSAVQQNEVLDKVISLTALFAATVPACYGIVIGSLNVYPPLIFKALGAVITLLLFLKSINVRNVFSEIVCSTGSKINCNSVLGSKGARIAGWFHWSDAGLAYFLGSLIILEFTPTTGDIGLISILSLICLPYIFYSVYYQWKVVKAWCSLCLAVQLLFLADSLYYLLDARQLSFSGISLIKVAGVFSFSMLAVLTYKGWQLQKSNSISDRLRFLKLKRNPFVFEYLLRSHEPVKLRENSFAFSIGNGRAGITVDAFLSLNCLPCSQAFEQLSHLASSADVRINLWFAMTPDQGASIERMARILSSGDETAFVAYVKTMYSGLDEKNLKTSHELFAKYEKAHFEQFKHFNVEATPAVFVSGYKLPSEYQISELIYLIQRINT